ncbi:PIN domain-containing protein [Candidatus Micrarchaeota archaeon]|nr:PIN domain-containing protein [Candidatus Micrarchaeota archaeon]
MKTADASLFIALFRKSDAHHDRAKELIEDIVKDNERLVVTTHVIEEAVTYLFSRDGPQAAHEGLQAFLNAKNIAIESVSVQDLEAAGKLMKKYGRFSLSDALSVHATNKRGLREILSFDSDFDHVERIQRVH